MKITFIIQDLVAGGGQYATALMVRGFIKAGFDVDLIVSAYHQLLLRQGKIPFEVPPSTKWIYLKDVKARKNILEIRRYLKKTDSVAVVATSTNYIAALRYASVGLLHKPKICMVEHGIASIRNMQKIDPPRFLSWGWALQRWYYRGFDSVMAVSAVGARECVNFCGCRPDRVHLVHNPVIDEVFVRKCACPARHPWLKNKSVPTFVAAGMHVALKNFEWLLEGFRQLRDEGKSARLVLFGMGKYTDQYAEFIRQNNLGNVVSLPGFTDNLPAEIKAADGFLVSSKNESFSIVIVEALGAGTPVISVDCDFGPREVLEGGKFGRLVPPGDIEEMKRAICEVAANRPKPISDEGWRRYTLDAAVSRYRKAIGV